MRSVILCAFVLYYDVRQCLKCQHLIFPKVICYDIMVGVKSKQNNEAIKAKRTATRNCDLKNSCTMEIEYERNAEP